MRYVWALLASAWFVSGWAQDCNALKGDERATCNAVQQNNPRFCEDVKVSDARLMCQAKVQPNSYTCEKIPTPRQNQKKVMARLAGAAVEGC